MVGTLVHQLTKNVPASQIDGTPLAAYYIEHGKGVYPSNAPGQAFDAMAFAVMGDPIADFNENLAAEQKARVVYDNILRVSDDPDVNRVIKYLREREVVHFQRFGEAIHTNLRRFFHRFTFWFKGTFNCRNYITLYGFCQYI